MCECVIVIDMTPEEVLAYPISGGEEKKKSLMKEFKLK
jgi:hypothetical protein